MPTMTMWTSPLQLRPTAVQTGFTLLEILVSLLVLSVGLLGLAGLQVNGLHNNQDSYYLSQAMAQAYDMADRMRANMPAYYDPANPTAGYYDNITTASVKDPGCISSGCSAAQMAQYDAYQWNDANSRLLPNGKGMVCTTPDPASCAGSPGNNVRYIIVMWDDLRNGVTGTACGGNPKVDLTCYKTSFQP